MAPRLLWTLSHIQRLSGGVPLRIVSAYRRPPTGAKLTESRHYQGKAVDLIVPGMPKHALFALCRSFSAHGCGFYPHAHFVHIDVREQRGVWVDRSAPGEPRDYVPNARQWLLARGLR